MSNKAQPGTDNINEMFETYRARINDSVGAERVWAYTTWSLLKEGYYSPDELINLSLKHEFTLDTPIAKVKRGTRIGQNVVVKNSAVIDGERVSIGDGTVLDGAHISGSDVAIGPNNYISGPVLIDHLCLGSNNDVRSLSGSNDGQLFIGSYNRIDGISIYNPGKQVVRIGDYNELHRGLSINCLSSRGRIRIGHYNSLGRDGGGVISTAYRFNKGWWGDVLIGSHVETTRGAEILGFSLLGWPLSSTDEQKARELFVNGPLTEVIRFFEMLWDQDLEAHPGDNTISLFGVVKVKMSCLSGTVKAKDDTRIQSSFLRDIIIQERSKVYFTTVGHSLSTALRVNLQDRAIEQLTITEPIDWASLPTEPQTDGYRKSDADFYQSEEHPEGSMKCLQAPLKVGLVGLGEQGVVHARYLIQNRKQEVSIEAICGSREKNLPNVQGRLLQLGVPHIPVYCAPDDCSTKDVSFLNRMLDRHPDLDAVIISTPHAMHYLQVLFCLKAGLHVLVDKPLTMTYRQAQELVGLAADKGKILAVSNQRRYEDAYHYVGNVVRRGELGQLRSANGILSHQQAWMHGWRTDPVLSGGGTVISVGYHLIDTLVWIANERAAEVNAYGFIEPDKGIEVYSDVLIRFESGFTALFTMNNGAPKGAVYERLQLWGTEGNITVDRFKPVYDRELPKVIYQTIDGEIIPTDFSQGLSRKWAPTENFVNSLLYGELLLSSGEQNLATMQIVDALYQSLRTQNRVRVHDV